MPVSSKFLLFLMFGLLCFALTIQVVLLRLSPGQHIPVAILQATAKQPGAIYPRHALNHCRAAQISKSPLSWSCHVNVK